jgi:hypothetical protein
MGGCGGGRCPDGSGLLVVHVNLVGPGYFVGSGFFSGSGFFGRGLLVGSGRGRGSERERQRLLG